MFFAEVFLTLAWRERINLTHRLMPSFLSMSDSPSLLRSQAPPLPRNEKRRPLWGGAHAWFEVIPWCEVETDGMDHPPRADGTGG